ncbi:hypothetical protein [Methanosarcina sp. KYL-1]|nr:hypothetical protein [Methanosarcina sp. KYL-1]
MRRKKFPQVKAEEREWIQAWVTDWDKFRTLEKPERRDNPKEGIIRKQR